MTEFGAALPPRKCTFAEKITENPLTIFLASCIMSKLRNGSIAQPGEHLPYKQGVTGSSPVVPTSFSIAYASVAQLVEQWTENPRVTGSIPVGATICGFSSSGRAPPCQGGGSEFEPRNPLHFFRHHSQAVRQRSAKPLFPGSIPGGASKTGSTFRSVAGFTFFYKNSCRGAAFH